MNAHELMKVQIPLSVIYQWLARKVIRNKVKSMYIYPESKLESLKLIYMEH